MPSTVTGVQAADTPLHEHNIIEAVPHSNNKNDNETNYKYSCISSKMHNYCNEPCSIAPCNTNRPSLRRSYLGVAISMDRVPTRHSMWPVKRKSPHRRCKKLPYRHRSHLVVPRPSIRQVSRVTSVSSKSKKTKPDSPAESVGPSTQRSWSIRSSVSVASCRAAMSRETRVPGTPRITRGTSTRLRRRGAVGAVDPKIVLKDIEHTSGANASGFFELQHQVRGEQGRGGSGRMGGAFSGFTTCAVCSIARLRTTETRGHGNCSTTNGVHYY